MTRACPSNCRCRRFSRVGEGGVPGTPGMPTGIPAQKWGEEGARGGRTRIACIITTITSVRGGRELGGGNETLGGWGGWVGGRVCLVSLERAEPGYCSRVPRERDDK